VGNPESYLQAHRDVLERSFPTEVGEALGADFTLVDPSAHVDAAARLVPPVYVGPEAVVERGARAGSLAVLGAGARVGAGAVVENSVLGAGAAVGANAVLVGSVVGDSARVGASCEVRNLAVVGPGATLGRGNELDHGLRIGADQAIPDEALRFT
jgi:mannose-1-phosphate guanylyltransferase